LEGAKPHKGTIAKLEAWYSRFGTEAGSALEDALDTLVALLPDKDRLPARERISETVRDLYSRSGVPLPLRREDP
jgi:hypothetical protein